MCTPLRCLSVALLLATLAEGASAASFMGLGALAEGGTSQAQAVSADGSTVVGTSYDPTSGAGQAFRWRDGVMTGLGWLSEGAATSAADDVSADGSVVVGYSNAAVSAGSSGIDAFRWQDGVMTDLGEVSLAATGVSANGSVVVGVTETPPQPFPPPEPPPPFVLTAGFLWKNGQLRLLEPLPAPNRQVFEINEPEDVSGDGSLIVGWSHKMGDAYSDTAVVWSTGPARLPLPSGILSSLAFGVSPDGSVVVGSSIPTSKGPTEASLWKDGSMLVLGQLTPGHRSSASAASENGSVVVGSASVLSDDAEVSAAFIWDEANGMRDLQTVLETEYGLGPSLAGWDLQRAEDVSANGDVIVGSGIDPAGRREGWIAIVPEPSTALSMALGLAALGRRSRRRPTD